MTHQTQEFRESLRLSWGSLYALVDRAPFGVYIVDSSFRIAQINASAQKNAFRNVDPAVGRDFSEAVRVLWPEAVAETVIRQFRHTLDTGESFRSKDYVHTRADSADVEAYEWELQRIALPDGMHGVVCYYFDSTLMRESEQALRQSEAWLGGQKDAFHASLSGAPLETSLGILVRSAIEHAGNDAKAAFFRVNAEGTALHHVVGMGEEHAQLMDGFEVGADAIGCGLAVHTGQAVIHSDVLLDPKWVQWLSCGRQFDYRASWSFPVQSAGGKVVGAFCMYFREPCEAKPRDLEVLQALADTAAVLMAGNEASEERALAEQALRDADRHKDEFLAMLAHELRNPLTAIGYAARILRQENASGSSVRAAFEILDRQVENMVRQVDDLLDVSRIGRGKMELRKERIELALVVKHAVESARPLCESRGHALTVRVPPNPAYVHGDPIRLAQVVTNLLNNAYKFTEKRGRITLTVEQLDTEVVLRVQDTGIGIAAAEVPRLFEMFGQVAQSPGRRSDGLGLGLALVKDLVEMHDGTVEARSAGVGRGSEFLVRLPALAGPPPPEPSEPSSAELSVVPRRVLVADDNRDSAMSLAMLLKMMGHEADAVHDGLEAVARSMTFRADVVLLDIRMPRLNGYEAAREIRKRGQHGLMLVALTGGDEESDRRLSKEAGFDAYLVKPVDVAALTKLLAASCSG